MQYEALICELHDQVALITLNRPDKRNALSRVLRDEIVLCLGELEKTQQVGAIVLTGAGSSFCAGFDLNEFQTGDIQEIFAHATSYHHKVYNTRKPIIAAVNGQAMAGGMDLAAMCDVRIAAIDSVFGQPQVKMGIAAAYDLLATVLPEALARELCLTGRRMDANEALAIRFVNEVVDSDRLVERAIEVATTIVDCKGSAAMKDRFVALQPDLFH
ncbi:MAG: enoyl-CoA hydratase/isomerase family protein [Proteobacteria bacterium]|nr:enoyl-CoA hydratase/isomerase family protein [Pseudomonadota bacterium]